jgi:hypothetical protein
VLKGGDERLPTVGVSLGERGIDEARLGHEVAIQGWLSHPGSARNGLDAGRADAAFVEQPPGSVEQRGVDLRGGGTWHATILPYRSVTKAVRLAS